MDLTGIIRKAGISQDKAENNSYLEQAKQRDPANLYIYFLQVRYGRRKVAERKWEQEKIPNIGKAKKLLTLQPGAVIADGKTTKEALFKALQLIPEAEMIPCGLTFQAKGLFGLRTRCTVEYSVEYPAALINRCCRHLDRSDCWEILTQLAQKGYPEAQYRVGMEAWNGKNVIQDYEVSVAWLLASAQQEHAGAQYQLGRAYEQGLGVEKNVSEAKKWYEKAAKQRRQTKKQLGKLFQTAENHRLGKNGAKNLQNAFSCYLEAAKSGHGRSQFMVARAYEKGEGTRQSLEEAVYWYEKAAEQGDTAAMDRLKELSRAVVETDQAVKDGNSAPKPETPASKPETQIDPNQLNELYQTAENYRLGRNGAKNLQNAFSCYLKAAQSGHGQSQLMTARAYEKGEGTSRSLKEAVYWYKKAAEQGNTVAMDRLKKLGEPVLETADSTSCTKHDIQASKSETQSCPKQLNELHQMAENEQLEKSETTDISPAFRCHFEAAQSGDVLSMITIARAYEAGEGLPADCVKACLWYLKAAASQNEEAIKALEHPELQAEIGRMYQCGEGVSQNSQEAMKWYRKAANQGNAKAQFELGYAYESGEGIPVDRVMACLWYLKAAAGKDEEAIKALKRPKLQAEIGRMYQCGEGVSKSSQEAMKWYRKAANQGNAKAQFELGYAYESGEGIPVDRAMACRWYLQAAAGKDEEAIKALKRPELQCELGRMYQCGEGVSKSSQEAMNWYRKAANQNDANAQYALGRMYQYGEGVLQSQQQAMEWYRKAADQGNVNAQFELGRAYESGAGVSGSMESAVEWYAKAASAGHTAAAERLEILKKQLYSESVSAATRQLKQSTEKGAPPITWELRNADADELYDHAVDMERNRDELTAILYYSWAAQKGSKKALCTLINMGAQGSLYFFDHPIKAE